MSIQPIVHVGDRWQHRNGAIYKVLFITNTAVTRPGHEPDVVYRSENGNVWSRPLSEWYRSFTFRASSQALTSDAEACLKRLSKACADLIAQVEVVHALWDTDEDAKVGKHLLAILGERKNYAPAYREFHDALADACAKAEAI